jgi:glycosyltransferase involved in cell wall biosynthesis
MLKDPEISVIMSVHNGEPFLCESIDSILGQTFANFEFIIVDDGSTDCSGEIIARYAKSDSRIVVISQRQKGPTKSLNAGIRRARGLWIARQDADDVSLPNRLQTMVDFLKLNPTVAAAGSWSEIMDETGRSLWTLKFPIGHERISWAMIGTTAIVHPSAVMKREAFVRYGVYNEDYTYAQDYELWTRWIRLGAKLANVPKVLVRYRTSANQISRKLFKDQSISSEQSAQVYINFIVGERLDPELIAGIRQLVGPWPINIAALEAIPWTRRLLRSQRFKRDLRFAISTRLQIASRIVSAVTQFGDKDRSTILSALGTAALVSPVILVEQKWWANLVKRFVPARAKSA